VFQTKLEAIDDGFTRRARLDTAPVRRALHRFVEGIIAVVTLPDRPRPDARRDASSYARMMSQRAQVSTLYAEGYERRANTVRTPDGSPGPDTFRSSPY